MVNEREQIRYAIATLEKQRPLLGDAVVDTTIMTLREKLLQIDSYSTDGATLKRSAQRKQVTILFANVTGLTAITESLPDTNILNLMNVLWQRLDSAITRQEGVIDKHIGDAVMGLFGAPASREDDPQRAVRAALAMRAALRDFIAEMESLERARGETLLPDADGTSLLRKLEIRIGINTGPVLLGEVGTGDEYTVIGDAVNVASRLEHSAQPGSILISHDTYLLVRGAFNIEALGPIEIRGRSELIPVYMVLGVKSRPLYSSGRGVEGIETPMVGRDEELRRLQEAAETAVASRRGQLVTVVGEAGLGKSRLLHEFNAWLKTWPQQVDTFKGRTYERTRQVPYAILRDLLAAKFDIQDNDPPSVVEDKLVRGVRAYTDWSIGAARERVRAIGQLVGLELLDTMAAHPVTAEMPKVKDRTYQYLADFFEQAASRVEAAFLFLEDIHWADAGTLEMVDYLQAVCRRAPLVMMCFSRQALFSYGMHTGLLTAGGERTISLQADQVVELQPLSDEDSRRLVVEILRKLPEAPEELCNMIVQRAEGNPFYLEELIKVLIDDGVIVTGSDAWKIQRQQLTSIRIPPNITGVLQSRLDRLSVLERTTLQRAAVVGRLFWDTAVIQMNQQANDPISAAETLSALNALEKREMIFPRQAAVFAGSQTYIFKHAILQQVAYESVLLRARPAYHKLAANWLADQSGERIAEYAGVIAHHFELAGENAPAAELYEMAAVRAQDLHSPAMAIEYYRKALMLISEKTHQAITQLRLQEHLGALLQMQARFVEAAQVYMTMHYTALEDGDLQAQAQALLGLAQIKREQGDYDDMLAYANQAEQVAWLVNAEEVLVEVLLFKAQAHLRVGNTELAVAAGKRALGISEQLETPTAVAHSLHSLAVIFIDLGRSAQAEQYGLWLGQHLAHLRGLLAQNGEVDLHNSLAYTLRALGELQNELGEYDPATEYLSEALALYRQLDDQAAAGETLNTLAETMRLRGAAEEALPLYREALAIAEANGDLYRSIHYYTNLGAALVDLARYDTAVSNLNQALLLVEDVSKMVSWRRLPAVCGFLALAYLGLRERKPALEMAQRAVSAAHGRSTARTEGFAWRVLAEVMAAKPDEKRSLAILGRQISGPSDCFTESVRLLRAFNGSGLSARRELALTLWVWSQYESTQENTAVAESMAAEAQQLAAGLGLSLPKRRVS